MTYRCKYETATEPKHHSTMTKNEKVLANYIKHVVWEN